MTSHFRKSYDFESRCNESQRIRDKYEDRVPIIVHRSPHEKIIPNINRRKFLVPSDLSMAQFMYVIRKRIKLKAEQSLFLFVGDSQDPKNRRSGSLVPTSKTISVIDEEFRDPDGFVYITYAGESTFGSSC